MRPLFGYKMAAPNVAEFDDDAIAIVKDVLAAPRRQVYALRRSLEKQRYTMEAAAMLMKRIRKHRQQYKIGQARADLKPVASLSVC